MATGHEAIVQAQEGPPYRGRPGQTRLESVHLAASDGGVRAVKVYRVVNVETHPELRERALSGELHRLDDGVELALPFVFHDPGQRKFALVIPTVLAHHELREWSALMQEIASDSDAPVPRYVREATTVLGVAALGRFLLEPAELDDSELSEASSPGSERVPLAERLSDLEERERLMLERERALSEQERGLVRTAEELTSREGELLRIEERLDTMRADLEIREQELRDEKVSSIVPPRPSSRPSAHPSARPSAHPSARPSSIPAASDARRNAGWQEVGAQDVRDAGGEEESEPTVVADSAAIARSSVIPTHRSAPPPLRVTRKSGPPPLRPRPRGMPPPLHTDVSGDDLTVVTGIVRPPPLPEVVDDAELVEIPSGALAAETVHRSEAHPEVEPPHGELSSAPDRIAYRLYDDELWLFVNWPDTELVALRASPDLMLQCVDEGGVPVLMLSLFAHSSGTRATVARLAVAAPSEDGREMLDYLERSFRARIAVYVAAEYRETLTVSMLREGVARAAREHLEALFTDTATPTEAAMDAAVERVLSSPPPLDLDDLPFGPARRQMSGTFAVSSATEQLHSWMRPDKLAEATLRYGVPQHVIEASARRVLRAAIVFGIALPKELAELAVRYEVAKSHQVMIAEQLGAFKQRIVQGENDLDAAATAGNWERLFAAADRVGVMVDPELRVFASSLAEQGQQAARERPLEHVSTPELRHLLGDPERRVDAFFELCLRGHSSSLSGLIEVLEDLSSGELVCCAPQLTHFGESAADPLVKALSSPSMHVRQVSALLLGRLRQRRTLSALVQQLEVEPTAVWSEIARAIGEFGPAALRVVSRALPRSQEPDRLMVAMAHLANHGCAADIERMENEDDEGVSRAARRAMARRSRLEWEDLAIREQRVLTNDSPTARLSQAFFAEVEKARV